MRVLTISLNAWNDTLATGNSFSNFFADRGEEDVFANIYCRNERIDNNVCSHYLRITEGDILRGVITFSSAGHRLDTSCNVLDAHGMEKSFLSANNKRGNILRRWRPAFLLLFRELIWSFGSWKGDKLVSFLAEFQPEIIYMHIHSNWYMHRLLWYCQKITGAKVVVFSGDDVWSYKHASPLHLFYHRVLRFYLRKSFTQADLVFGGSHQLCEEYGHLFNVTIEPLYKTCNNICLPQNREHSIPFKAVYSGNLLYGRDDVLIELVSQLRILNSGGLKLQLSIYSNTLLSEDKLQLLNDGFNCKYEGSKPYAEVMAFLNECDFSVFVESFNQRSIKKTRLSFSTKIIDYLQAASAIIAVGPSEVASISFLKKSSVAFVVEKPDYFIDVISRIIENPQLINESIDHKYDFAMKNHCEPSLLPKMRAIIDRQNE